MKKDKFFQRFGTQMIAGTDHNGRVIKGKGIVHRHVKGAVPHGLSKLEEEIWKLKQKEKNK
jgi:hypothetical protein